MSSYRAPVKDMTFILNHLAGMLRLAQSERFSEASSDMVNAILEESARLSSEMLAPTNKPGDLTGVKLVDGKVVVPEGFAEAYQQYAEGGWGSLQFDAEYGGQGLPYSLSIPVMEMWQSANLAWGLCPLLTQGAIEAITHNASDELKAIYLEKMISSQWAGTMNLTEPHAGTDLAVIRTRAEREGDHYRIFGQKIFITWGDHEMAENIVHLVLARTPDAPAGVKGISLFVVPKYLVNEDGSLGERNDVQVASLEHKLGIHASPTCVMSYGEADGAIGYLVGEEGAGLIGMFTMMNNARLAVGLQGVSLSERAYQHALNFAHERVQGRAVGYSEAGPIVRHADVRRMLVTMKTLTEAARAITYDACASLDFAKVTDGDESDMWQARAAFLTPIVKGWATEIAQEVTSLGVQIHGGMGFIEETGAAQYYRDARILPIYEGTNGIQALDLVGRKTLSDQGTAAERWFDEVAAAIEAAAESGELAAVAERLAQVLVLARAAQQQLLADSASNPQLPGTIAFHYLMLFGYLAGGWQLLRAAQAAEQFAGDDADYQAAKLKGAVFFSEQLLPRAHAHAAAVTSASATLDSFSDEMLSTNLG